MQRSLILQGVYSIRRERLLIEQLENNLLLRRFVGLSMDEAMWHHSIYSKWAFPDYAELNIVGEGPLRWVVRNGSMPQRTLLTGMGPMCVRQPRADDRGLSNEEATGRFFSPILPRYLRRVPSVDNLLPVPYLKGVSSKQFLSALASILGEGAKGLCQPRTSCG